MLDRQLEIRLERLANQIHDIEKNQTKQRIRSIQGGSSWFAVHAFMVQKLIVRYFGLSGGMQAGVDSNPLVIRRCGRNCPFSAKWRGMVHLQRHERYDSVTVRLSFAVQIFSTSV